MTQSNEEHGKQVEEKTERTMRWRVSRRGFLIGLGVAGAGLALGVTLGWPEVQHQIAKQFEGASAPGGLTDDPLLWFDVLPDGRIRLYLTKVEMGQGVHTSLAQIAIEELEIPWEQLEIVQAPTGVGPADTMGTAGSSSVSSYWDPLRRAAATLREMLRAEAALQLGVSAGELVAREGGFESESDRITYGELAQSEINWQVPENEVPLKATAQFQIVGQPVPRVDLPDKITGQAVYGFDARLYGMLYGAVARPPMIGAELKSAQPGEAASRPGVQQVVIEDDFVGVIATTRQAAWSSISFLDLEWKEDHVWEQEELEEIVTVGGPGGVTLQREGKASSIKPDDASFSAEYRTPFASHAPLEPQAALADVTPDRVRVWISTQTQYSIRGQIAKALDRDEENVEIIPTYLGGGFGRKAGNEVGLEAARLSAAAGAPVHVGWNRADEMQHSYLRPLTQHHLSAILQGDRLEAMQHQQASGDVFFYFLPEIAAQVLGADFGAFRGASIFYEIPNRRAEIWRRKLPVPTGWWRGLGLLANTFAVESFMDELAHAAGQDPLAFRLAYMPDSEAGQRMRAVLEAAAERAEWGTPLPPGRGRGIACSIDVDTVVAEVTEVSVNEDTGEVQVHRVTAAMDPGRVINPDGARAQVEGAIMMGISSALIEEITVRAGQIEQANFDTYPLLTIAQAPVVETILLAAPDGRPRGVGEPPIGPIAAAIANAVYAASGARVRQLPLTPERVLGVLNV